MKRRRRKGKNEEEKEKGIEVGKEKKRWGGGQRFGHKF